MLLREASAIIQHLREVPLLQNTTQFSMLLRCSRARQVGLLRNGRLASATAGAVVGAAQHGRIRKSMYTGSRRVAMSTPLVYNGHFRQTPRPIKVVYWPKLGMLHEARATLRGAEVT